MSAALLAAGLCAAPALQAAPTPHASLINAGADNAAAVSNTATEIDVLANDSGVDKSAGVLKLVDPATGNPVDSITTAQGGVVAVINDKITYTPDPSQDEYSDNFEYQVVESDWRGTQVLTSDANQLSVLDAGDVIPASTTETPTQDIQSPGGLLNLWESNSTANYFGRLGTVSAPGNFDVCPTGASSGNATMAVTLDWQTSKDTGSVGTFGVALTHNNGDSADLASASSVLRNPSAATGNAIANAIAQGSSASVSATASSLSAAQFGDLRFGLYASNRDAGGSYKWNSLGQTTTLTVDTSSCDLATARVTVNVAVDNDEDDDGVPNVSDLDDDNDGLSDVQEGGDTLDSDGDLTPNRLDLDSDGDGLFDIAEAGLASHDSDDNGLLNGAEFTDTDNNGFDDIIDALNVVAPDSDNDQMANFLDLDSDNDGLGDVVESGGTDANFDGKQDAVPRGARAALTLLDIDNDGLPNHADTDRDGDGIPDLHEAGGKDRFDSANGNGVIDRMENSDGNTLLDAVEVSAAGAGGDSNNNGVGDNFDAAISAPDGSTTFDTDGDNLLRLEDGVSDTDPVSGITTPFTDGDSGDPDDDGNGFDDRFPVAFRVLPQDPIDNPTVPSDPGGAIQTGLKGTGAGGPLLLGGLALLAALRRRIGK